MTCNGTRVSRPIPSRDKCRGTVSKSKVSPEAVHKILDVDMHSVGSVLADPLKVNNNHMAHCGSGWLQMLPDCAAIAVQHSDV